MTRFIPSLVFLLVLLLAGCVSTPGPTAPVAPPAPVGAAPKATAPVAPALPAPPSVAAPAVTAPTRTAAPIVEAAPASIIGSEESSLMFDSFTAYVVAVDGRAIPAGRAGWNTPVALPAGPHRLTVEFNRGVFTARTELTLKATPAAAYQLKYATDAEIFGKNSYCEFWIVETASGEPACQHARVPLTRIEPPK